LRIALITHDPRLYTSRRLIEAATVRGHQIEPLEVLHLSVKTGSPPHLLGIIGSVVVVVGVTMSGDRGRPLRSADVALGAVLLGTAMLPVMEYDWVCCTDR